MRQLWTLLSPRGLRRRSVRPLRAVRSAHVSEANVERWLLVLFFVVFAIGAVVVVVEGSLSGQSFSALVGGR